jgi:soluble lytic murein transglycosylase-like protein
MAMRVPGGPPTTQDVFSRGDLQYQRVDAATPEAFGAMAGRAEQGAGQALEQASNETSQTILMKQQFANETSAMTGLNSFQQTASDLLNGNAQNGTAGFKSLRGQNAIQAQSQYRQQLQQAYDSARASLNPAAQRMFDMSGRWALRGAVDQMGDHAAQEQVTYNATQARASVQLNQQAAVDGADDPDTWNSALAATQQASLKSSQIAGLSPEATEAVRQSDLSKIYVDRTRSLEQRDPIAAQKFYQSNIGMVAADQRYGLEQELHQLVSTQYAATDGVTAYQNAIGRPAPGALPQNFNAPIVKPYNDQQINDIVSAVKKPSPYDSIIDKVAGQYHINPTDLKMRLVSESGLNPAATSSQGAQGIAQLMPDTAKALNVDPHDPAQAIDGAARLIVKAEGSGGAGNPSAVDRAYYGGATGATGPNTDQYVANLQAVRNRLYGPSNGAPLTVDELQASEGNVIQQAQAVAEQRRPGDAAYADRVVSEATKNWARQLQSVRDQNYSNMSQVLDTVVKSNMQSVGELPANLQQTYAQLTGRDQLSVQEVLRGNQRQASGEFTPSDPKTFNDTQARINLPAGDPNRLTDPSQITPLIAHGLNYSDSQKLITEMKDLNSPELNPFLKQVNGVKQTAQKMLTSSMSPVAMANPDVAQEASYRFGVALDDQISAMRKAGKNPQTLFDPSSPDYVLSPARVASFMPTEAQMAARATAPTNANRPGAAPARLPGESPAAYLARTGGQ